MLSFLKRNKPLVVSCLLMTFSLHVVSLSTRDIPRKDLLRVAFQEVLYPFQEVFHGLVSLIQIVAREYLLLQGAQRELALAKAQLERLEQENLRLREATISYRRLEALLELDELHGTNGIVANVIGMDGGSFFRSIVVNRGARQGVKKGMVAISTVGVVGQVFAIAPDSSRVLLIVDPHSGLDALVQRSRARGIIQGNLDGCIMKYVRREDDVQLGDQIISSGLDGVFPKGLAVGTVSRVIRRNHSLFQSVEVKPRVNFSQLEEVLILPASATG